MSDTPPFTVTPEMVRNPEQLSERLNALITELFRDKADVSDLESLTDRVTALEAE